MLGQRRTFYYQRGDVQRTGGGYLFVKSSRTATLFGNDGSRTEVAEEFRFIVIGVVIEEVVERKSVPVGNLSRLFPVEDAKPCGVLLSIAFQFHNGVGSREGKQVGDIIGKQIVHRILIAVAPY